MPGEVYIFDYKIIRTLSGLIYKNIGKMVNKIFNVLNDPKMNLNSSILYICLNYL